MTATATARLVDLDCCGQTVDLDDNDGTWAAYPDIDVTVHHQHQPCQTDPDCTACGDRVGGCSRSTDADGDTR